MSAEDALSFQFLAENSADVICRAGVDTVLHYVSPSSFRILGWKPEEMTGKRPYDFIFGEDRSFLPDSLIAGLDGSVVTVRMRRKDGTTAWIEIKHRAVCDPFTGETREKVIVMRDITERKHLEDQLSALELTDAPTGLSTHRAFDEALEREWNRTLREGSEISLLLLDFNHFRQFHDWRQHREGDRCLGEAAAAVIGALRLTDFAARYGAEDIAIILPSTDSSGAAKVAEKVQSAVQALRSSSPANGKSEGRLTVSIGAATVSARPGATPRMPEILCLAADNALQKAKGERIKKAPARAAAPGEDERYG
jgi:diguanylate cyclase (GGDEF)-like protein/PAS domain S-box-containing protein